MKKRSKSRSSAPKVDPYLEGLMAKLLERLIGLEKKIDRVLAQTAGKAGAAPQVQPPPHRDRVLYEAICAECHKVCEVPFKPTEARPVYCKECWAKRKGGAQSRPGMPVLTPVAVTPKVLNKSYLAQERGPSTGSAPKTSKKTKKSSPAKKSKKKKK